MKTLNLTPVQQSVLTAVENEALTSFDILKRVSNVDMLLSLYNVLDELRTLGAIKSFMSGNMRYHVACA